MKITFEMTKERAIKAALKAGAELNAGAESGKDAELIAMGIMRRSVTKISVKSSNQLKILNSMQADGYRIVSIEVA